jgi:hypothetical protein
MKFELNAVSFNIISEKYIFYLFINYICFIYNYTLFYSNLEYNKTEFSFLIYITAPIYGDLVSKLSTSIGLLIEVIPILIIHNKLRILVYIKIRL